MFDLRTCCDKIFDMIRFGTDGWRAIISEEFTFNNVGKVVRGIAKYLLDNYEKPSIVIGYDARFLADKFALYSAKILLSYGIDCFLTEEDTPTPAVAWSVKDKKTSGAIMFTASHNPAEYGGIKFIPDYAGPANEKITKEIEKNLGGSFENKAKKEGKIERFDPLKRYSKAILSFIDQEAIKEAKLKIVYDPLHGSGRRYVGRILQDLKCDLIELHSNRDVLFGGLTPEPSEENLSELIEYVKQEKAQLGLANDGDADRFGVIDERGDFLSANQIFSLLFYYLVSQRKFKGAVVRSVATTHLIDKIAEKFGVKTRETPVGFKYIAEHMMKEKVIIGGEESGGISILGHIPEKDGILANMLVVEMISKMKKPLSKILEELYGLVNKLYNIRINLALKEEKKIKFLEELKNNPPTLADTKISEIKSLDGLKIVYNDGSWFLVRPSGTEPVVRIYCESQSPVQIDNLVAQVKKMI